MDVRPSVSRLLLAALLAAVPGTAWAAAAKESQEIGIEIGCRGWRSEVGFEARVDKNGISGSGIDEGTLALDTEQLVPVPYLRLGGLGNYLLVDYFQQKYDNASTLATDIAMSGTVFAAGTAVNSKLNLQIISGYYNYALTDPAGSFQAGVIAGVKYYRIEGDVESDTGSASMRMVVPAPVVGTLARMTLMEGLEITGQIDGLQLPESVFGTKVYVFEAMVEVAARMGLVSAGMGYSYSKSEFTANGGDDDEMKFEMLMDGPYAVVSVRF